MRRVVNTWMDAVMHIECVIIYVSRGITYVMSDYIYKSSQVHDEALHI